MAERLGESIEGETEIDGYRFKLPRFLIGDYPNAAIPTVSRRIIERCATSDASEGRPRLATRCRRRCPSVGDAGAALVRDDDRLSRSIYRGCRAAGDRS